jgi:hypothetical protein
MARPAVPAAEHIALGIDTTLDALDVETAGGLRTVLEKIETVGSSLAELHERHDALEQPAVHTELPAEEGKDATT